MISYVFWHAKHPEVEKDKYEESLVTFHKKLFNRDRRTHGVIHIQGRWNAMDESARRGVRRLVSSQGI